MTPLEVSMQWSWDRRTLSYPQESYPLGKGQVKSRVKLRTCPWKYQHLWHTSREVLVPVKKNAIAAFSLPSKPDQGLPQSSVWKTELNQKSPWQLRSSDAHSCVIAWPLAMLRALAHLPACAVSWQHGEPAHSFVRQGVHSHYGETQPRPLLA